MPVFCTLRPPPPPHPTWTCHPRTDAKIGPRYVSSSWYRPASRRYGATAVPSILTWDEAQ